MNARFLIALTSAAALCACNSASDGDKAREGSAEERSASNGISERNASVSRNAAGGDVGSEGNAGAGAAASGSVEAQIAAAAERGQRQVPVQMGGATITAVQANGNELITSLTLPLDLNQQMADQLAQPLSAQQCGDARMADLLKRGARLTWRLTDSQGESFSIRTSSC